jgi:hypothetical protein
MSSLTDMAATQSSMPASQAGENFINIQELRELIYKQITPMNSHEYAGLFLSCKTINEEATESLFKPRRKLIAAEKKRCSKLYRAPVRIQQPNSISDLRNARVELPQSMFVLKLMRDLDNDYNEEDEEYEECYDSYEEFQNTLWPPKPKQRRQPMCSEPLDKLSFTLYADTTPDLINDPRYDDCIDTFLIGNYIDGITSTVIEMRQTYLWQRLANRPMPSDCLLKAKTVVFDWCDMLDSELPPFLPGDIDHSHWHTEDWAMSMKKMQMLPSGDGPTRDVFKWKRQVDWKFDHRTEQQQHHDLIDFKAAYKAARGGNDPEEVVEGVDRGRFMWPSDTKADAEAAYNLEWPALSNASRR